MTNKTKKPRKPLTPEQKAILVERMKKAREAKNKKKEDLPEELKKEEEKEPEKKNWIGHHELEKEIIG